MKKIIVSIIMCFLLFGMCYAKESIVNRLIPVEKELKSYGGENISVEKRVENAEIIVFGEKKSGNLEKRVENLSIALGLSGNNENEEPKYEIEDDVVANYPVVDELEKKMFSKIYNENIYKRLERLEKEIDGKIYTTKPLNERVSYLKEKILLPEKELQQEEYSYNYYSPQTQNNSGIKKADKQYVGRQYDDEDENTRKERLKAIDDAKKAQKEYRANKFAKYASTAIQLGGIALLILAIIL